MYGIEISDPQIDYVTFRRQLSKAFPYFFKFHNYGTSEQQVSSTILVNWVMLLVSVRWCRLITNVISDARTSSDTSASFDRSLRHTKYYDVRTSTVLVGCVKHRLLPSRCRYR